MAVLAVFTFLGLLALYLAGVVALVGIWTDRRSVKLGAALGSLLLFPFVLIGVSDWLLTEWLRHAHINFIPH